MPGSTKPGRPHRAPRATTQDVKAGSRRKAGQAWSDIVAPEQRFRSLVEQVPAITYVTAFDDRGTTLYVSPQIETLLGYAPEEWLSDPGLFEARVHPDDRERAFGGLPFFRAGGESWEAEYRMLTRSGEVRWFRDAAKLVRTPEGEPALIQGVMLDITAVMRTRDEHNLLTTAIAQSAETVLITDAAGTIVYVNPAFERLTGYTRAEIVGQNPRILRSGRQDDEFYRGMWATLSRGETWRAHFVNRRKDGTLYDQQASISCVRDAAGQTVNYVAVGRDITHELSLEAQLIQAQKMEAVGRLAGGVAHDFNNLLTIISANAEFLSSALPMGDPRREDAEEIRAAAARAASLTRQLLAFSRRQILQPRVLDLRDVVTPLEKMLRRLIGEDIELTVNLAEGLGTVKADPGQIEQVIMNLVVNARDAMTTGGHLTIATSRAVHHDGTDVRFAELPLGSYLLMTVSDTGAGMTAEVQSRVFEPFFTTKKTGTGLGLATVYGIVKQSGGAIWIDSEIGRGTTIFVALPETFEEPERLKAHHGRRDVSGSETILLVEDETAVRMQAKRVLERAGYTVVDAASAADALGISEADGRKFDLLLTDVVMPRMSGKELADRLVRSRPATRVLFTSGYTDDAIVHHGILDPGVAFLEKPFTPEILVRKVRDVLDADRGPSVAGETSRNGTVETS